MKTMHEYDERLRAQTPISPRLPKLLEHPAALAAGPGLLCFGCLFVRFHRAGGALRTLVPYSVQCQYSFYTGMYALDTVAESCSCGSLTSVASDLRGSRPTFKQPTRNLSWAQGGRGSLFWKWVALEMLYAALKSKTK